jgi:ABC-type multidrug transport system fused ATPase/permease subunit
MDDGKIIEKGTHRELLRLDGSYARLSRAQDLFYMAGDCK